MHLPEHTLYRKLTLDRASVNEKKRSIDASLSSEYPVERFFGNEVLRHDKDAVNLERAGDNGLPLLFGHNADLPIGRARKVRIDGDKLRARLDFSENSETARSVWADIRDGFLTDISLGYRIDQIDESGDDVIVTRFTPLEASIVSVPADPTVGINRSKSKEDPPQMTKDVKDDQQRGAGTVEDFTAAQKTAKAKGVEDGVRVERQRVADIEREFVPFITREGVAELKTACIEAGRSVDQSKSDLLQHIAGNPEPAAATRQQSESHHGQRIEGGKDESEKWVEGMQEALELRVNLIPGNRQEVAKIRAANEFTGMSLMDMARDYLMRQRVALSGMSRHDIAGNAFVRAGMHSTSDFANLLENVANKSLLSAYDEAPETWRTWCRVGNLSDFKEASRVNMSTFSDLEVVPETGEYKEGHYSDLKETIQLLTYGKLFTISRQAIINDDTSAFDRIPRGMGLAAARQVGDLAYAVLTANATMNEDSVALFDTSTHGNLAGSGAVISETTLDAARNAMATQTGPAPGTGETGATLNIAPRYLIVPSAILMAARKVVETPTAPDTAGDLAVNTMRNAMSIVWDARLDADSTTQWYVAGDQNLHDTVEVGFLDGSDAPMLESQDGFKQDGATYKVRLDAAASAIGWRAMYSNPGA